MVVKIDSVQSMVHSWLERVFCIGKEVVPIGRNDWHALQARANGDKVGRHCNRSEVIQAERDCLVILPRNDGQDKSREWTVREVHSVQSIDQVPSWLARVCNACELPCGLSSIDQVPPLKT